MTDLEAYKWEFRKVEAQLLAERKKLLSQKLLVDRVFTSDAAHKRAELERLLGEIDRRILEVRRILGDQYRNN